MDANVLREHRYSPYPLIVILSIQLLAIDANQGLCHQEAEEVMAH